MSISANSLSMIVECLINNPTTEQTLILTIAELIYSSIFFSRAINAELINELLTFEFTIIDSKY